MARTLRISALVTCVAVLLAAGSAQAVPLTRGHGGPLGFGSACLGPNDDGSSAAIDLSPAFASGLHFFGASYRSVYVNTNGNISFGGGVGTYTPRAFPVASQAMIAPYWADVDIRGEGDRCARSGGARSACQGPANNGVWWSLAPGRFVATWHAVGYFECRTDKRMSFQLILTEVPGSSCGVEGSDFDVEMRYARCEWTTGDASGGTNGFGGTEAQAGFDAGNGTEFVMLPGSRTDRVDNRLCNGSNVGEPGIWRFQIRSGAVVCPDAGTACTTGLSGVCAAGRMSCVGEGTVCVADVEAGEERCNALDDDCDGTVDEGSLCSGHQVCDRGACIEPCFEGGCAEGFTCDARRVCVESSCESVGCPDGQRCVDGACTDACASIACPAGRECRAGRCVDPCGSLECGECGACTMGSCVPRCDAGSCDAGSTCVDGLCVPSGCAACPTGTACVGGACVDACDGATCPSGERCELGECVPAPVEPPVAPPEERDASAPTEPSVDGGTPGYDAASPEEPRSPPVMGGCSIAARAPVSAAWGLSLLVLARLGWRTGRRPRAGGRDLRSR